MSGHDIDTTAHTREHASRRRPASRRPQPRSPPPRRRKSRRVVRVRRGVAPVAERRWDQREPAAPRDTVDGQLSVGPGPCGVRVRAPRAAYLEHFQHDVARHVDLVFLGLVPLLLLGPVLGTHAPLVARLAGGAGVPRAGDGVAADSLRALPPFPFARRAPPYLPPPAGTRSR